MNPVRQRPLSLNHLRALDAVGRRLGFNAAADELHLTQSAVSRQIKALEAELGVALFLRGTRHVELTPAGATLLRAVTPWLGRLDATVRQIRQAQGRRVVSVSTFGSFATLWLIPRLTEFQQRHPDIDIRVGTSDQFVDTGEGEAGTVDVALRYCLPSQVPPEATRLFDDLMTPAASPWLIERARGDGAPLLAPPDLSRQTLLEEEDLRPSSEFMSWANWLRHQGLAALQPARWLYFNFTHQQVQAALAGQGVALARLPLTIELLQRGELVELFPQLPELRLPSPYAYWMLAGRSAQAAPEVQAFCAWVADEARATRDGIAAQLGG